MPNFGGSWSRVLAIDSSEDRVNEYMNIATHAVVANAQDEMTLRSLEFEFRSRSGGNW